MFWPTAQFVLEYWAQFKENPFSLGMIVVPLSHHTSFANKELFESESEKVPLPVT